jgi:hypothetical protein
VVDVEAVETLQLFINKINYEMLFVLLTLEVFTRFVIVLYRSFAIMLDRSVR